MAEYKLSQEEVDELKEVFQLFDKDNDGFVATSEVGPIMLSLNQKNFSDSEAQEMSKLLDPKGSGKFDFKAFQSVIAQKMGNMDKTADVIAAFQTFDKDLKGSISADELKHVLTKLGDPLNQEELQAFLKEAGSDSKIAYEPLVKKMMA